VNTGFDEDQAEFGVFVFSVYFEVFSDRYCFFDEMPEVCGERGGQSWGGLVEVL